MSSPPQGNHIPTSQASNIGSNFGGGDLLGFGNEVASPSSTHSQPTPQQNSGGFDLMGFGSGPSQPPPQQQQNNNSFGFDFGGPSQPQQTLSQPPNNIQKANSTGGFNFDSTPSQPQKVQSNTSGFVPITNTNPNKIMGYENQHLQIWFDCISEGGGNTKLFTTYINKTNNTINEVNIQAAVLKHVKLTINPLSSTTLQPYSKEVVHQVHLRLFRL